MAGSGDINRLAEKKKVVGDLLWPTATAFGFRSTKMKLTAPYTEKVKKEATETSED